MTPPILLRGHPVPYPADALRDGIQGRVHLELVISAAGRVDHATVLDGPSASLGEAARQAVLLFEFSPAHRDGVAQAARIRFAYDFHLPDDSVPPGASPATQPGASPTTQPGASPTTQPGASPTTQSRASLQNQPGGNLERSDGAPRPVGQAPRETKGATAARAATAATADEAEAYSVTVRGYREGDRLRRSAAAVTVVDLEQAQRESSNMAAVLARIEGVNVQQVGGLGSQARFSLAGFDDTQVRFFVDGIPLEYQGFSLGIQNVPLSFAERVEVYKGVVPIQFGADTLGGAFNLVTDRRTIGTRASASYQGGSFDTHRAAASARHLDGRTGLFVKGEAFLDTTKNDYPIDATVADSGGQTQEVTAYRFHDAYGAGGGNLEVGVVGRKWANRLLFKTFVTGYDKEIQHNARGTKPYGEVTSSGVSAGASLRYEHEFGQGLSGRFVSGYVYDRGNFVDDPECVYNWLGQCRVEAVGPSGEMRARRTDQSLWDHTGFLRWSFDWNLRPHHQLGLSTAPTLFTRTGDDHLIVDPEALVPLNGSRTMFKWISGAQYKVDAQAERFENILFVKNYLQSTQSEELLTDTVTVDRSVQRLYWGVGDGARFSLTEWAILKASYEYSVRLPEPREMFGNGAQVGENLELRPERSHNINATFLMDGLRTSVGRFDSSVTGFFRKAKDMVLLLGRSENFFYENIVDGRVLGVEGAATWRAPGEFFELSANATYQDFRNKSTEGPYAPFEGDRLPNRPYFFANGRARLWKSGVATDQDELSLTWYTRYVHQFFLHWESVGQNEDRPSIDSQLSHSAVLSYAVRNRGGREVSFSLDVQNITNEKVYDLYGIQRPTRAVFGKVLLIY